jgi:hypothetical protein
MGMMPEQPKKTSIQDLDIPTSPDEEKDESYGDLFGKWVREKLRTGKSKMREVD